MSSSPGNRLPGRSSAPARRAATLAAPSALVVVRRVRHTDLGAVIAIDAGTTRIEKPDYWEEVHRRYGIRGQGKRHFLVAELEQRVVGFIIGEVRDWEFGSPPCGWVFAIDVDPQARQAGIGASLLAALTAELQRSGVRKLRTLLSHDNTLILSFFRSQGMMAAPLIPLEMDVEP